MRPVKWFLDALLPPLLSARALAGFGVLRGSAPEQTRPSRPVELLPLICLVVLFVYGVFFSNYALFSSLVTGALSALVAAVVLAVGRRVFRQRYILVPIAVAVLIPALFHPFHPATFTGYFLGGVVGWFSARRRLGRCPVKQHPALPEFVALTFVFWFLAQATWESQFHATGLINVFLSLAISIFYSYNVHFLVAGSTSLGVVQDAASTA